MTEQRKRWLWVLGLFVVLFAIATATCWNVLSDPEQVLAFNDGNIEGLLSGIYNFPDAFYRVWDNQLFFGSGGKQYPLSVIGLGEYLGPAFWRRTGQPLLLALCGLAIYGSLRQFRFNRPASALTAAILVNTGWSATFAFTGLAARPLALTFAFLAMGLSEMGRTSGRWLPYAIGGACLGLGISEVPDVGAIMAVAVAFVFLWTHLGGCIRRQTPEHGLQAPASKPSKFSTGSVWSRVCRLPSVALAKEGLFPMTLKLALFVAFSVILSWQMLSAMVATNIQGVSQGAGETPAARYAWATQWSIPPSELWNTVSGSYFGTTMRSDTTPYWGRIGRSEGWEKTRDGFRNFGLTGWHLGVIPCILLLALPLWLFLSRKAAAPPLAGKQPQASHLDRPFAWMLCTGSVLAIMLLAGKHFVAYRLLWLLPFFDTIRNPEKWNGPLMLFAGLAIALMLDALWNSISRSVSPPGTVSRKSSPASTRAEAASRPPVVPWNALAWASFGIATLGLLVLFWTQASQAAFIAARTREGYGAEAALMWNNALAASLKVFILASLFGASALWISRNLLKGKSLVWLFSGIITVLSLGDLIIVNRAYSMPHKYRQYLMPNPLTDFLDAHRTEGRLKLIPPHHPLLNNLRLSLLQIKGYDLFEPISVSRMPADYEALFKAVGANLPRLWELGAVRYFLTLPGTVQQLNLMDGNRGRFVERLSMGVGIINESYLPVSYAPKDQQHLRLVEFTGAFPFYRVVQTITCLPETLEGSQEALRRLAQPDFDTARSAVVQSSTAVEPISPTNMASITLLRHAPAEATLRVAVEQAGLLVRSVKFDPDWTATVDDKPVTLYRVNYLFQGIRIPAGQHTVSFAYAPSLSAPAVALAGRGLLLLMVAALILSRRQRQEA